jgi:hypothetical protein
MIAESQEWRQKMQRAREISSARNARMAVVAHSRELPRPAELALRDHASRVRAGHRPLEARHEVGCAMKRYLVVILDDADVIEWERGFLLLGLYIAREAAQYRLEGSPELKAAEQVDQWRWKLLFVWPEQPWSAALRTEGVPSW